jgi:hypothetical protein
MTVQHYLIGYSKVDGSLQTEIPVPAEQMAAVKRLLPLYGDDPDALDPYELSSSDAARIANLSGRELDARTFDFFLQALGEEPAPQTREQTQTASVH